MAGVNTSRLHLLSGWAAIGAFAATGAHMRANFPGLYHGDAVVHYMYRANHVYILFAGLLNLAVGTYLFPGAARWRRWARILGSFLYMIAPAIFIYAFFHDPPRGGPDKPVTVIGVLVLIVGTGAHLLARARAGANDSSENCAAENPHGKVEAGATLD